MKGRWRGGKEGELPTRRENIEEGEGLKEYNLIVFEGTICFNRL